MGKRKHISLKTRCASLLVQLGLIPYADAKQMTEDQVLSLFHVDHNILHESEHEDRDKFWNLTHRYIADHREKTKRDVIIISKGRRLRNRWVAGMMKLYDSAARAERLERKKRKIQSRGFDKTLRKKMDGTVERRK